MAGTHQGTDYRTRRTGYRSHNGGAGNERSFEEGHRTSYRGDRREDRDQHQQRYRPSWSFDTTGLMGMLIGGAVGYALAEALRGHQPGATQISREYSGILPGYGSRSEQEGWSGSSTSVEMDETTDLIASNKVEGTAVYNRNGERLGDVYNFMVGKRSGRVAYAVMSFGGLLGMGQSYHPVPWNALTYDTKQGGYVINADKNSLTRAPSFKAGEDPFTRPGYGREVQDFWSSEII